jgi:7-keto-8-aminopelargonate synthetase-like enzyme
MQAYLHQGELEAWLEGSYSPDSCTGLNLDLCHCSPTLLQHELRLVTLFSLNDYLGLSTHSAVKAAAAAAAIQVSAPRQRFQALSCLSS